MLRLLGVSCLDALAWAAALSWDSFRCSPGCTDTRGLRRLLQLSHLTRVHEMLLAAGIGRPTNMTRIESSNLTPTIVVFSCPSRERPPPKLLPRGRCILPSMFHLPINRLAASDVSPLPTLQRPFYRACPMPARIVPTFPAGAERHFSIYMHKCGDLFGSPSLQGKTAKWRPH